MSTLQELDFVLLKQSYHDIPDTPSTTISSSSSYSTTTLDSAIDIEDPPSYDCIKPTVIQTFLVPPYYTISPREEEGNEELPDYSCTVYKRGYVYMKQEYDVPYLKTRKRLWRKVYMELWGTLLQIHKSSPHNQSRSWLKNNQRSDPMFIISLAGADASRALDYFKRPNALRLICSDGPQFLIQVSSHIDMISWIEHLQAAINISLDLESRPMPSFVTIPARELTHNAILDHRLIEIERAREQRRRNQHEILI